jgi:ParB family chromosome partitioning protein
VQRADLNPIEEAMGYNELIERYGYTQEALAEVIGKSRSHLANTLRLLKLPDSVRNMVQQGQLSAGHGRALIGREDAEALANRAVEQRLSVREVEKLARGGAAPRVRQGAARDPAHQADIAAVQAHLEELLGLSVKIACDADPRSGAVTIRYRTLDQLDLICQRLTGGGI